ncbi:PEP-CTERM sorting domain-containing protein [Rubritalea tangerina]
MGSFTNGETITIAFVSGVNPFDSGSSISINGANGGATGPSVDLAVTGLGTVQAGTILSISTSGGDGSLLNSLNVSTISAVPEPSTVTLLGLGGISILLRRQRR